MPENLPYSREISTDIQINRYEPRFRLRKIMNGDKRRVTDLELFTEAGSQNKNAPLTVRIWDVFQGDIEDYAWSFDSEGKLTSFRYQKFDSQTNTFLPEDCAKDSVKNSQCLDKYWNFIYNSLHSNQHNMPAPIREHKAFGALLMDAVDS